LRGVGIDVRWHWEKPGATRAGFPVGAALVLITTDCNAHALSAPALSLARAINIPVVHIPHRWSAAAPVLARAGWVPVPVPSAPVPVPVPVEVPVLDLVPSLPKPPPAPPASPLLVWIPAEPAWVRDYALKRLAADPQLTSRELATALNISESRGSDAFAAARKMLTIRGRTRSVPARILDMDVYRAWCTHLRIDPVATPEPEGPPEGPPEPMPEPMPEPAPMPPAPTPAPETGSALDASVSAACSLLLAAMRAANVTQISVSAAGDVSWTRLVVTTGTTQVSE